MMIASLQMHSERFGQQINPMKTVAMTAPTILLRDELVINDKPINVENFNYLGSVITAGSDSCEAVRRRIGIARNVVTQLTNIWKAKDICLALKVRLMKSLVWPLVTYASESWTLKQSTPACISAFE